jgi:hypothetical protein
LMGYRTSSFGEQTERRTVNGRSWRKAAARTLTDKVWDRL